MPENRVQCVQLALGGERALADECQRPPINYLQSGQQPVPASFVAALTPVPTKATSAIANPKTLAFMENPPAHQGQRGGPSTTIFSVSAAVTLKVKRKKMRLKIT